MATSVGTGDDLQHLMRAMRKSALERMLDAQMQHHLDGRPGGHRGDARGQAPPAERALCQDRPRRPRADPARRPRDRDGTFEPQLVAKHQRRQTGFDDKILARYAQGMTTRDLQSTTNAIESVNSVIRKFTRNRKQSPNAESAWKRVYLAIHEASKKWTMPISGKAVRNHFALAFEGRIPQNARA